MRILREPAALIAALLPALVGMIVLFAANLTPGAQAGWNAAAVAVAGFITAATVARERLLPAVMGLVQAVLALMTVYGFGLTAEQSTAVTGFVALAVGMWLRGQVDAPVDELGVRRRARSRGVGATGGSAAA